MSMNLEATAAWLGADLSPTWLPLPPSDEVVAQIHRFYGQVRGGLPELNPQAVISRVAQVRSLYLSEGVWVLGEVCRRMGFADIIEAGDEWLGEAVTSPEFAPLSGPVAIGLLTSAHELRDVPADTYEEFMGLAAAATADAIYWWEQPAGSVAPRSPFLDLSLDGCAVLRDEQTLVWLVSWSDEGEQLYKALAQRTG